MKMAERRFYLPARLQWWGLTLLIMPWLHAATSVPAQAGSAILERTSGGCQKATARLRSSTSVWGAGVDSLLTAKGALRLKGGGPRKEVASAEKLSWQQHLIVGGVARGVSVGSLFPIDSIKTRMQVGQKISLGLSDLGQHFRGFGPAIVGQIPYGMLVFGSYETLKARLFEARPEWRDSLGTKIPVYVGCAVVGDTMGALWLTPSEILKQRMQSGASASAKHAIESIYQTSGLKGFYSGLSGLLARDIPYRAMQLPLYEVARDAYASKYCTEREIRPVEAMFVGAAVGMMAAGLTTPFDVVKSRMMVGTSAGKAVSAVLQDIWAEAGARGLFKGASQRVGYLGLNNAIFFNVYEFARTMCASPPASHSPAPSQPRAAK